MSSGAEQPFEESDEMGGESQSPYQAMWIAHWVQTRRGSSAQVRSPPSLQHQLERESAIFESSCELQQPSDVRSLDIMTKSPQTSSEISTSIRLNHQPIQISGISKTKDIISGSQSAQPKCQTNPGSENDTIGLSRNECRFPSVLAWSPPPVTKSLSRGCQLQSEGTPKNPQQQVKSRTFLGKNSDCSRSFQDDFKFSCGTPLKQSLIFSQELNQSSSVGASHECFINDDDDIGHLQHEQCTKENFPSLRKQVESLIMDSNKGGLSHDSSVSNSQLLVFDLPKMTGSSDIGFLPSKGTPAMTASVENKANNSWLWQETPNSSHGIETDRQGTALASMEVLPGAPMEFSWVNRHCEGGQTSIGTFSRAKQHMFCEFVDSSSDFNSHRQPNTWLQARRSFKGDKGKGHDDDLKHSTSSMNINSGSSAETDVLDLSALHGEESSAAYKDLAARQLVPTSATTFSLAKDVIINCVPNKDGELDPAGRPSCMHQRPSGSSTTQSLDREHPQCQVSSRGLDPGSRWVKRLKRSLASSSGHNASSTKSREALFPKRVNELFSQMMKQTRSGLDPGSFGSGRDPVVEDQVKKGGMVSDCWVWRWCKQRKRGREDRCPSAEAMALMGKALGVSHSCKFDNRGAFVVWKTEPVL